MEKARPEHSLDSVHHAEEASWPIMPSATDKLEARAFQIARTGPERTLVALRATLLREGFSEVQIDSFVQPNPVCRALYEFLAARQNPNRRRHR